MSLLGYGELKIRKDGNEESFAIVGGFLAALVVFLFIRNLRVTVIAGIAIPISIIGTFTAMKIMFITGFAAVALNPDSQAPKDAKVLSKPFHLRDLVDEVNRLMAA